LILYCLWFILTVSLNNNAMKAWQSGGMAHLIHNLSSMWRWVVIFIPLPLYLRYRTSGAHWQGDWVDLGASVDTMEKGKSLAHTHNHTWFLTVQFKARHCTDWAIQTLIWT
jgi:hypothetical protein